MFNNACHHLFKCSTKCFHCVQIGRASSRGRTDASALQEPYASSNTLDAYWRGRNRTHDHLVQSQGTDASTEYSPLLVSVNFTFRAIRVDLTKTLYCFL